jgi:hypothetical protein
MSKLRRFGILKLGVLLEKQTDLKDNLVKVLFFGIVMRFIGLDSLIILKHWVVAFQVFKTCPALA